MNISGLPSREAIVGLQALTPACAAAGARQRLIEAETLKLPQYENHASAPAVRTTQC